MKRHTGEQTANDVTSWTASRAKEAASDGMTKEMKAETIATLAVIEMIDYTDHNVDPYSAPISTANMPVDPMGRE